MPLCTAREMSALKNYKVSTDENQSELLNKVVNTKN